METPGAWKGSKRGPDTWVSSPSPLPSPPPFLRPYPLPPHFLINSSGCVLPWGRRGMELGVLAQTLAPQTFLAGDPSTLHLEGEMWRKEA